MKHILVLTFILKLFASNAAFGGETNAGPILKPSSVFHTERYNESFEECLVELRSSNMGLRSHALSVLRVQRVKAVGSLIDIVQGEASQEVKIDAIRALGQFHAVEATEIIVKNLYLEDKVGGVLLGIETEDETMSKFFPVSVALQRIGAPAIIPLIECVAGESDSKINGRALKIICRIDGDVEVVQLRLQKALKMEKDSKRQERLQSALKIISGEHFNFDLKNLFETSILAPPGHL